MKYLFAGLGNIGSKYDGTRHNIGFDVVDAIATEFGAKFITGKLADRADFRYRGKTIYLLKPNTYMNLSGKAVKYWLDQYKISTERLLVIVDDIALPFGKLRLRGKGSHAGHNGLASIEQLIGGANYPRLRFGIGDNFSKGKQVDYVLGKWSDKEDEELASYIETAQRACLSFVAHGLSNTMTEFN